jgi:uncharacterized protein YciI
MLYCFFNVDKPGTQAIRKDNRPAHKAYLADIADKIAFAGPLLGDDGITMQGSLLVIDFADQAAARAWVDKEPFNAAGLYESVSIRAFQNLWPQRAGFPPTQ